MLTTSREWHLHGRKLGLRQWRLAIMRGVILTFAQFFFYLSLGIMAFATASTISYANAPFMVALAVPILGEKVGAMRWVAVLVGFAGVIMIVQPGGDTFTPAALLPLAAALCYALIAVTSRLMDDDVPTPLINLYSTGIAAIGAVSLALVTGGFSPLHTHSDLWWIAGMGAFGGTAVLFLTTAYRMTEQSNLAPFSYFGIPIAFVFGWLFFDEAPWRDLFPGALLIVAAGLLILWRERRLRTTTAT